MKIAVMLLMILTAFLIDSCTGDSVGFTYTHTLN